MSITKRAPVVVAIADEHDAALRYAAAEAVRDRRPLRVVHVVPPPRGLAGPESVLITFEAVELVAEQLLRYQYDHAVALVNGAVPVEKVLPRGAVVDRLLELSADADHLVVQHRNASRLGRLLTGSTAAALGARCPVPVVSVPELWPGPRPVPHVTVGLGDRDVDGREQPLLEHAFAEAEIRRASLTALHAWYLPSDYGEVLIDHPTLRDWQDAARRDLEHQVDPWRTAHPSVDVRVEVPHLRPADALLRASRDSDLLVVARRRAHGPVHLGLVVRTVVRESLCPVMVVTPARAVRASDSSLPMTDDTGRQVQAS